MKMVRGIPALLGLVALGSCSSPVSQTPRVRQDVRCIFIDAGAHRGQSYTAFQKSGLYSKYNWEIFAIEANPYVIEGLPKVPNLTVIDKAIWVEDGTLEFNLVACKRGMRSGLDAPGRVRIGPANRPCVAVVATDVSHEFLA